MSATFHIPPHPAGTIELLRARGHAVTVRQNRYNSLRYRIDDGRELTAHQMSLFYERHYESHLVRVSA